MQSFSISVSFLILLVGSFWVTNAESNSSDPIIWLILQYHKTGYMLSRSIFRPLATELDVTISYNAVPCRRLWRFEDFDGEVPYFLLGIHLQEAAEMHFKWKDFIHSHKPKIVHFVRDPYEFLISSYLYHSQSDPPSNELILNQPFNPCLHSEEMFDMYYAELSYFNEDVDSLKSSIAQIATECKRIYLSAKNLIAKNTSEAYTKHAKYGELLRKLSAVSPNHGMDALRLEAYRSILFTGMGPSLVSGNDLFRMAVNALRAKESEGADVMQTQVEDFPYDNEYVWKRAMGDMLDFLFDSKYLAHLHQLKTLKLHKHPSTVIKSFLVDLAYNSSVMNKQMVLDLHGSTGEKQSGRFVHLTKSLIPPDLREKYKKGLKEDKLLGPVLATFRRIIFGS
jgi:hypothetical protein